MAGEMAGTDSMSDTFARAHNSAQQPIANILMLSSLIRATFASIASKRFTILSCGSKLRLNIWRQIDLMAFLS